MKIAKIQSSGIKGTESAALAVAQKRGIPVTGYRPLNAKCQFQNVKETPSTKTEQSVIWNVRDSHATLLLGNLDESPMASLALEVAQNYDRPHLQSNNSREIIHWLNKLGEEITLNVVGPNSEEDALSEAKTKVLLEKVLSHFDAIFVL